MRNEIGSRLFQRLIGLPGLLILVALAMVLRSNEQARAQQASGTPATGPSQTDDTGTYWTPERLKSVRPLMPLIQGPPAPVQLTPPTAARGPVSGAPAAPPTVIPDGAKPNATTP